MSTSKTGYGAAKMPGLGAHLMASGFYTATLGGAVTMHAGWQNFAKLDPGGAHRDVTLPAEEGNSGMWFLILNTAAAAENLVVKDDAAATIVTISQNEAAIVTCDGSSWEHMGIITIALS